MSRLPDHLTPPAIVEAVVRYECPKCGNNCQCGVPYVAKTARAAEYAAKNPTASVREIADQTGVGRGTAHRAKAGVPHGTLTTGQDGRAYPATRPAKFISRDLLAEDAETLDQIADLFRQLSWPGRTRAIKTLERLYRELGKTADEIEF